MIHQPAHRLIQSTPGAVPRRGLGSLRIGAVQYLNTKPLVHGLAAAGVDLVFDLPSRLADGLADGDLDVALVPTVEFFRGGYGLVSDACIGCRGPVMSVKLFLRTPAHRVATLAVDEGSRTSVALARILLAERDGVRPRIETLPIGAGLADTRADAVLLIGDRALDSDGRLTAAAGSFQLVWDLGDEWCRWTGLPFVFAVWAARPGVDVSRLEPLLTAARDAGVANLAAIAAAESAAHGLTVTQCLGYLRDNLHFQLGPREREGLWLFRDFATQLPPLASGPAPSRSGPVSALGK